MSKVKKISTKRAPIPVGPYSQGIIAGDYLFTAGQIAVDPDTGKLVKGGIKERTHQALRNLQAVIEAAGADMSMVVRVMIYLTDFGDFKDVNEVYKEYFKGIPPARSCVEVGRIAMDTDIEIDAIVYLK